MSQNARFTAAGFALIVLAWAFSGERLLDALFAVPDLGPVDDWAIAGMVALEEFKGRLHLPDAFGALRTALHAFIGV
ncbi:MAG: hypothetical protein R3D80_20540 [Paracoccaceae bacterium]